MRKGDKWNAEELFCAGVIVEFSNADRFSDLVECVPAIQRDLSGAPQKISRKKETEQSSQVAGQAHLPIRHEIPDTDTCVTAHMPVIP